LKIKESKPNERITGDPKIKIVSLSNSLINKLKKLPKIFYLFYALVRVLIQFFQLFYLFWFKLPKPKFILVQVPRKEKKYNNYLFSSS